MENGVTGFTNELVKEAVALYIDVCMDMNLTKALAYVHDLIFTK